MPRSVSRLGKTAAPQDSPERLQRPVAHDQLKQALDVGSLSSAHIDSPVAQPINQDASACAACSRGRPPTSSLPATAPRQPNLTMRRAWTHCSPSSSTVCAHTQVGLTSSEPRLRQTSWSAANFRRLPPDHAHTRCNWHCDRSPAFLRAGHPISRMSLLRAICGRLGEERRLIASLRVTRCDSGAKLLCASIIQRLRQEASGSGKRNPACRSRGRRIWLRETQNAPRSRGTSAAIFAGDALSTRTDGRK